MAKAKTKKIEQTEQERQQECLTKIRNILAEYGYALVPENQPTIKLYPVQLEKDGEQAN